MSTRSDADIDAEMAAAMSELHAELGDSDEDASESAAPEADSVKGDPEADEKSEDEESEEELEDPEQDAGSEEARAEVAKLFSDGDLKGACAKLGLDPSIFKLNNRQFAAARKAETSARADKAAADQALASATQRAEQAERLKSGAEQAYGPIAAGFRAYKVDKDMTKAKAAIELMFEDTFENVKSAIEKGARPMSAEALQLAELKQQMANDRAAAAAAKTTETAAAERATFVVKIGTALSKTPLADVDGASEAVAKAIEASWNPALKKHTLTLKEAYTQVKAGYAKQAAALAKLSAPKAKIADEPEKPAKRGAPARKPLAGVRQAAKPLTQEETMAAEMAAARKEWAAEQRRGKGKR